MGGERETGDVSGLFISRWLPASVHLTASQRRKKGFLRLFIPFFHLAFKKHVPFSLCQEFWWVLRTQQWAKHHGKWMNSLAVTSSGNSAQHSLWQPEICLAYIAWYFYNFNLESNCFPKYHCLFWKSNDKISFKYKFCDSWVDKYEAIECLKCG